MFFLYQGSIVQWLRLDSPGMALVRMFTSLGSFEQLVFLEELEPFSGGCTQED